MKGYREMQKAADANGTSVDELKRQQTEEKKKFKDFSPKVREHLAKSIHFRRQAAKKLGATRVQDPYERQRGARPRSHKALQALFDGVAQRYLERPGGYLRVLRTSQRQLGDGTQKAVLGFVGGPLEVEA